jgi:hypothetical protein
MNCFTDQRDEAAFLEFCRRRIERAAADILEEFAGAYATRAASAFVEKIGADLPDPWLASAVKTISIREFEQRGVL